MQVEFPATTNLKFPVEDRLLLLANGEVLPARCEHRQLWCQHNTCLVLNTRRLHSPWRYCAILVGTSHYIPGHQGLNNDVLQQLIKMPSSNCMLSAYYDFMKVVYCCRMYFLLTYQSSGSKEFTPFQSYTFRTESQNLPQEGIPEAPPIWCRRVRARETSGSSLGTPSNLMAT